MTTLIILRGNSGSGKTTIAKNLQKELGEGTLLVSQDTVRREMLLVKDTTDNLSIELIKQIASYGLGKSDFVIVEEILTSYKYRTMLVELIALFQNHVRVYYFDLPFEETLRRHSQRKKVSEFALKELAAWWNEQDYLAVSGEQLLTENLSEKEIVAKILTDLKN